MRIVVPAIKAYHDQGSKGGLSTTFLLSDIMIAGPVSKELRHFSSEPEHNSAGKEVFENCLFKALCDEFVRNHTYKTLIELKLYHSRLTDERAGKLFRTADTVEVSSVTGNSDFCFKITDQDYNLKSEFFNEFLSDLFQANSEFVCYG
jgi:hypothetical protein